MATVPKTFADDFALVERHWLEAGNDTPDGIAEIRDAIRQAFNAGGEAATYWQWRIADEAKFIRELRAMGAGMAERIKATAGAV
ncbi:MAG: hypothetical protein Q8L44_09645 [Sulfuritalea sp.]|nr:hypothetical protein [Sulfuritalea sp.]